MFLLSLLLRRFYEHTEIEVRQSLHLFFRLRGALDTLLMVRHEVECRNTLLRTQHRVIDNGSRGVRMAHLTMCQCLAVTFLKKKELARGQYAELCVSKPEVVTCYCPEVFYAQAVGT